MRRRRPINVLASVLTTLCLYCGVVAIFAGIAKDYDKAVYMILAALIFDMLDGTVARITKSVSEFGKELDSLCDLVAFGVAPAVLVYMCFLPQGVEADSAVRRMHSMLAILFVICGALRLARFNVYQSGRRDIFTGLPIPVAGGTIASFVLFARYFAWQDTLWILGPIMIGLSFLMVSTVRYPKDKLTVFILKPRDAFRILGISALLIAIVHYAVTTSPALVLFPAMMTYVLFGIAEETLHLVGKYRWSAGEPEPAQDVPPPAPSPDSPSVSKSGDAR